MPNLNITGNVDVINGVGALVTVNAADPSSTITNTGNVRADFDGILVNADPPNLIATGAFILDNFGSIRSTVNGRGVNYNLLVSSPGSITIINRQTGLIESTSAEAIATAGDSIDTITNMGTIIGSVSTGGGADTFNLFTGSTISGLLDSGTGADTVNLQGTGQGSLNNFANVEVINLLSGDWTLGSEDITSVNFQTGPQTLGLAATVLADGQFDGIINNFTSGDVIGLRGIGLATSAILGANNLLTIAGGATSPITLELDPLQDFSGQVFALAGDGAGGTNIMLVPAATAGGSGNDILGGTSGADDITSGNGNDIVFSGDGNDDVSGGNGNDTIRAGNGNSVLSGENGQDTIIAGNGNNTIAGGNNNDAVTVGNGNNNLSGGNGNDTLIAGDGNNGLAGGNQNDTFTVGDGNNSMTGGNGDDTFHVGTGDNILTGGNGGDTFVFRPDFGMNVITDFRNNDQIQFVDVFANFDELLDASLHVGADTVITLDADSSVRLAGVSLSSLQEPDFLLT